MNEYIIVFIAIFVVIAILNYVWYKQEVKRLENTDLDLTNVTEIYIEKHDKTYLAYDLDNNFIGQDQDLENLCLNVCKSDSIGVKIYINDTEVLEDIKSIYENREDSKTVLLTSQDLK